MDAAVSAIAGGTPAGVLSSVAGPTLPSGGPWAVHSHTCRWRYPSTAILRPVDLDTEEVAGAAVQSCS